MTIQFATAPCSWGVEDPKNPHNPGWERVLDEAAAAGYKGMEIGPYGYIPLDLDVVVPALERRGLHVIGGTLYDDLVRADNLPALLKKTEDICSFISQLPKVEKRDANKFAPPYLVIIDNVKPERSLVAGNPAKAPRLEDEKWSAMMKNITAVAKSAWEKFQVRAVVHPHAGGYIEFADEIEKVIEDIPANVAGICLDTGHLYYSGMDPVTWLESKFDRIDYIHFKDINKAVYDKVIEKGTDFFDAAGQGVMCPIGSGAVDYKAVKALLEKLQYQGWICLEQERDPKNAGSSLEDVALGLNNLKKIGF